MRKILFFVFILAVFFPTCDLSGQNATAVAPLRFGNVYPGIPKTVAKHDAGAAAEFSITGIAGDEVSIEFTLPTYMNYGGNHIQLVFTETDCSMDSSTTPDQSDPDYDNLDPWHPITYTLGSGGITVWLGATVIPNINQAPGNYSATIVLTVTPTGS
jgi:hypothetical protein